MNNTQQTPEEALNILTNAVEHAQSRGSWGLGDAINIARSLDTLRTLIDSLNAMSNAVKEVPMPTQPQPKKK